MLKKLLLLMVLLLAKPICRSYVLHRSILSRFSSRSFSRLQASKDDGNRSFLEQASAASIASAAAVAVATVNQAVSMRVLDAPDNSKSYVQTGVRQNVSSPVIIDEVGLPLTYDKDAIQKYWSNQRNTLAKRWAEFVGLSLPFLTKMVSIFVQDGSLSNREAELARDARIIIEKLGPTYIKMGQMMSVRPDVLPPAALHELKELQDNVKGFETSIAIQQIESELGAPLNEVFSEISMEPIAAASLAQVYKARLLGSGEEVAIKVQRPRILETVSKDLYVLRRAAAVYQGLMNRFAPQQKTNYEALLNEWAVGFYTELNFENEAANQIKLKEILKNTDVYVPHVYLNMTTRRVLVTEWVEGEKLSSVEPEIIKDLILPAQEAFLTQLLKVGFFHADPHPGNILLMDSPKGNARLALIDCGLVATIDQADMDRMVSALIHLANKDYTSLVDDFIGLGILPQNCDRSLVIPLMDKALTPYVKGGGAKKYEQEIRKQYGMDADGVTVGGLQAMTSDALTVLNDIPFSIPPYFALLGRAIITLEGVALSGNPDYSIITEAYPFVARKLLSEDRPEIQQALQQVLYSSNPGTLQTGLRTTRLTALLNAAMGIVSKKSGEAFINFDSDEEINVPRALNFVFSNQAGSLRSLLEDEAVIAADILLRQAARKSFSILSTSIQKPRLPFIGRLPLNPILQFNVEEMKLPFILPQPSLISRALSSTTPNNPNPFTFENLKLAQSFSTVFSTPKSLLEILAPKLSREEEIYALALTDLATQTFGKDAATVIGGDALLEPVKTTQFVLRLVQSTPMASSSIAQAFFTIFSQLQGSAASSDATSTQFQEILNAYNSMDKQQKSNLLTSVNLVAQKLSEQLSTRLKSVV